MFKRIIQRILDRIRLRKLYQDVYVSSCIELGLEIHDFKTWCKEIFE